MRFSAWSTLMFEFRVTTVWPLSAKGCGWLTSKSSVIETISEPCDTAAGETLTLALMTTVPVRELMITRAGALAGVTSRFSIVEISPMRAAWLSGALTLTETGSLAMAAPAPSSALMLSARRMEVVKSG